MTFSITLNPEWDFQQTASLILKTGNFHMWGFQEINFKVSLSLKTLTSVYYCQSTCTYILAM